MAEKLIDNTANNHRCVFCGKNEKFCYGTCSECEKLKRPESYHSSGVIDSYFNIIKDNMPESKIMYTKNGRVAGYRK